MTNKEKAKEFKVNDVCCVWNGGCPNVYNAAMEMAEWKDKQFKEYLEKVREIIRNSESPQIKPLINAMIEWVEK